MSSYNYISVEQPIGCFYIISMKAIDLMSCVGISRRSLGDEGIQRDLDKKRVNDISVYCSDPDATFPTSIIVSINDREHVRIDETARIIEIDDECIVGTVIDGQHRLIGISRTDFADTYQLPVVLMFDLTIEEQAYVFSIINSKQAPISSSLIFDLFDLSSARSPQRTAHEIARALNKNSDSPFYNRLKMLGKRTETQDKAMISQGAFANALVRLILRPSELSYRPHQLVNIQKIDGYDIRNMYIDNADGVIYKVILNCFTALKNNFEEYWENPKTNILWKSSGFGGVMKALPFLISNGVKNKTLGPSYFNNCFRKFKAYIDTQEKDLTSESFPGGGEQVQKEISKLILLANDLLEERK